MHVRIGDLIRVMRLPVGKHHMKGNVEGIVVEEI